jgi:hypothetical protein
VCLTCAKHDAPTRRFLGPDDKAPPRCPIHRTPMVRQANKPYHRSELT